ncbi:MAG: hypothetical protein ACI4JC_05770 [Faecalibacterium sp.]
MTKAQQYEVDFINSKIVLIKKFYKAATILNTPEYTTLMQLRRDNPGFAIELREIKKKEGKKSYRNLTYKNMEEYIITLEGEESENLKEFNNVLKLSKVQAGPYAYVKTWFLKKYGDAFKSESEVPYAKPDLKLISNN